MELIGVLDIKSTSFKTLNWWLWKSCTKEQWNKKGYEANIAAVMEKIGTEQKWSKVHLAKIFEVFEKKKKKNRVRLVIFLSSSLAIQPIIFYSSIYLIFFI